MSRNILLWSLAVVVTMVAAVYQRVTGPTYPASGQVELAGQPITYQLDRSHGGDGDQQVAVVVPDIDITGFVAFRRHNAGDSFQQLPLERTGDTLVGYLPHQPPAGNVEYYLHLFKGSETVNLPSDHTLVIRFKGDVPVLVLIPHVLFIFLAMLWSTRAGLEALHPAGKTKNLTIWTFILLFVGGMIMGPIVQKYAFGQFWTGVPFGWDLTDNKTLIAFVGWLLALYHHHRVNYPRWSVLAAAILLIVVFCIPHSIMGSELDYSTGEVVSG